MVKFKKLLPKGWAYFMSGLLVVLVFLLSVSVVGFIYNFIRGRKQRPGKGKGGVPEKKVVQPDHKCRILIFGIDRCGKSTLIKALFSVGELEHQPSTEKFEVYEDDVTIGIGDEKKTVRLCIADYKGDKPGQITQWSENPVFFGSLEKPLINAIIFLVDLFPSMEDSTGYSVSESRLIERYKKGARAKIRERVQENEAYVTKYTIDQILEFASKSEQLLSVQLLINKIDLLKMVIGKGYLDIKDKRPEEYAAQLFSKVERKVSARCESINVEVSTHVVNVKERQGTAKVIHPIIDKFLSSRRSRR